MPPSAAAYVVARTYLGWILDLLWRVSVEDNLHLWHAQQGQDEDHYDLERVKERILGYLAVRAREYKSSAMRDKLASDTRRASLRMHRAARLLAPS